jgi:hypothetical protein
MPATTDSNIAGGKTVRVVLLRVSASGEPDPQHGAAVASLQ